MPKLWGRFNRLIVPLFTMLALLVLFGIYQRYYVQSQEAYLTEHGFRILAAVGRQLDAYIDSITKTVEAARDKEVPASAYLRHFIPRLLTNLSPGDLCFEHTGNDQSHQCPEKIEAKVFSLQFGSESGLFLRTFERFPVAGRVRLDSGLRDLLNFGDEYFDDILIANPRGQVLFQKSQDNRIVNLVHLTSALTHSEAGQPGGAGGFPRAKEQVADQPPSEDATWKALSESSNVIEVKVASGSYRLFVEPFRLSSDGRPGEPLVLCGLWRTERLSSDSFEMPYSYVVWFGLTCVATGCFLWPFLKINYMSRTERLRQRDGWLLVFSIFLGTTSVTLIILNGAYASQIEKEIDHDLGVIAKQIQKNVNLEIKKALEELATLSATPQVKESAENPSWKPRTEILSPKSPVAVPDLESYPFFDFAFWLNSSGLQKVKFTSDDTPTPQTYLGEYPFFKAANDKNAANVDDKKVANGDDKDANAGDDLIARSEACSSTPEHATTASSSGQTRCIKRYSLEARISPNTGRFYTLIAAPFTKSGLAVQALAIRPLSLVDPVLPPNFGFAVLERDGRVLFHSNALRNLSENFIQECKDPSFVHAALSTQWPQYVDMVYSGRDRRALLTKVTGLAPEPLTLVVFHNVDIDRTVELAIVIIVSVLMGLCGLVILAAAVIDGLRDAPYPPEWVWPRRDNSTRYALILATNGLLVLTFLVKYSEFWEMGLLAVTLGVVLAGIVFTYCFVAIESIPKALGRSLRGLESYSRYIYVAAGVSLLAVTTVVPTFGFFKFAHDAASELATKHEQMTLLNVLADRENRIVGYSHAWAPGWITQRRKESLDRYDTLSLSLFKYQDIAKDPSGDSEASWHQRFDQVLASAFRLFPTNQLGIEMRMLPFESASNSEPDVASTSNSKPHAQFYELGDDEFRVKFRGQSVDASFAKWPNGGLRGSWIFLGLTLFLVGCWVTLLTKRIVLPGGLGFLPFEEVDGATIGVITTSALVLRDPGRGTISPLIGIAGTDYVDLQANFENPWSKLSANDNVVVLDHFDFNINNRWSNLARLQLVERLLYKEGRRVIIGSSVDPVAYLSEGDFGILADSAPGAAELLGRWKLVMSSFRLMSIKDRTRDTLVAEFKELIEKGGTQVAQSACWIKEECDHTPFLRELGLTLLARLAKRPKLKSGGELDPHQLRDEVQGRASSYYEALWSTLTSSERLVLYQLREDGWANPSNGQAIRQLLRKGILCFKPMPRIMNESFRLFAFKAQDQNEIADWERQGRESSWRTVKFSIITIAVTLAAWLLYAQKDLFQSAIGYVVAIGGAVAAISNLLGSFKGRPGTVPKAPDVVT